MSTRKIIAGAVTIAALAGGTAAVAATTGKQAEQEVLADAAERLGVGAGELRSALEQAQDAQLDQAVEDGELTQDQADAIKAHRERAGTVLGPGHRGGPGGPHGHGGPGGVRLMDHVAEAVGISERRLFEQLRNGRSIAQIARANGKTLAEVKSAVKAAAREDLDQALADGDLTQAQHDELVEHLDEHVDRLGQLPGRFRGGPGHHGPWGGRG